jgi:hypothetical protein
MGDVHSLIYILTLADCINDISVCKANDNLSFQTKANWNWRSRNDAQRWFLRVKMQEYKQVVQLWHRSRGLSG